MSRVGKKPIAIPAGVTVTIGDSQIEVKGPKGTLSTPIPEGITFKQEDGSLIAERQNDDQAAFHGLARALANNAVVGVTEGFKKELDVVGVGYKADVQGRKIVFALGYSHPVVFDIPKGIEVAIDKQTHITVTGVDEVPPPPETEVVFLDEDPPGR